MNMHYLDSMFPLKPAPPSPAQDQARESTFDWLREWFGADELDKGGIGGSGFEGADERVLKNEFMESEMELGICTNANTNTKANSNITNATTEWNQEGLEETEEREGLEMSYLGAHGEPLVPGEEEVLVRGLSFPLSAGLRAGAEGREGETSKLRVKDLSRLWLYVNGKSPKVDETDVAIARMATI